MNAVRPQIKELLPENCAGGPTFAGAQITADADLVVDGLLLDFKSARRPLTEPSAPPGS
ncbi:MULTISPECIES: hypothetical protein [Streptomyces]|uniref:hypothetical protein n=1 Tax=Streptomyces TaxID=1883 RepID=UPI00131A0BDB|nr:MULTISPECIES: hypothetical protein [Streptomyces]MYT10746.1 hypothetical protein [Streptomyces sp. SID5470]